MAISGEPVTFIINFKGHQFTFAGHNVHTLPL